ncbi:SDR family NAD(P)-dependent oxidoreductase [Streptomyces sp. NBC_00076]|uniref:SDR family NAD(P)-dependent oxidoreductase n=1 Tax=Streptomyces sp. NBC_00076 TaxID=2975642 RepID=UPI003255D82D
MTAPDSPPPEGQVAVVGMAGRFPGAPDLDAYWRMVAEGRPAVRDLSDAELRRSGVDEAWIGHRDYVKAAAVLDDIDRFDASFFDMSPREAAVLDPQHRLFLETCWHALEHAGLLTPDAGPSHVGVFGGAGGVMAGYLPEVLRASGRLPDPTASVEHLGVDKDFLATRVSYKLHLTGPALTVQTACSTSMVAVHLACQSLLNGECSVALAGGVTVRVPAAAGYFHREGGILSPDGRCLPFDENASGTLFGSGVAAAVLKPLEDALRDGDTVYATILGTAVNNDGGGKASYGAASVTGQLGAMRQALAVSGIDPATIGYVEAHGTGVPMGDPIEIAALRRALGADTASAIGSVKALVGHLEAAAGVAGLVKAVLALHHGVIPPSPYFTRPNPQLHLDRTAFDVNRGPVEWAGAPRRAAVNSLGIGGTNAFAVLQQAPAPAPRPDAPRPQGELLTVSARTAEGLRDLARAWADRLREPGADLPDLAHTSQVGRRRFPHLVSVTADSAATAADRLDSWLAGGLALLHREEAAQGRPRIAFLYSGQGSQYPRMALGLYRDQPLFKAAVDRYVPEFVALTGVDPLTVLADAELLGRAELLQPAFFLMQVALTELWERLGVRPDAVVGHSLGEYAAACAAGVFDAADGLRLVARRGRAVADLPQAGRMVAVGGADLAEVEALVAACDGPAAVAAHNAPDRLTVSGSESAIAALEEEFAARGRHTRPLDTTHAFHSPLMEPAAARLRAAAREIAHAAPRLPFVTNVTGAPAAPDEMGPEYWARQLTAPVRFADGIAALLEGGATHFVEIGPAGTLAALGRLQSAGHAGAWLPTLGRKEPDTQSLLAAAARLVADGARIDWPAYFRPFGHRRVAAPLYPFARQRHWVDGRAGTAAAPTTGGDALALRRLALPQSSERRFETRVGTAALRCLDDHVILGRPVVPGAYHTACLLEAATDVAGAVVEDLVFPRALLPGTGEHTLQVVVQPAADAWSAARVLGLDPGAAPHGEGSWQVHGEGRVRALDPAGARRTPERAGVPGDGQRPYDVDRLYADLRDAGYRFGPSFRWIERLALLEQETFGEVTLTAPSARERTMALLDSCIQTAIAAAAVREPFGGRVLLPFRVERAVFHALGAEAPDCGRVRVAPRVLDGHRMVADVWLTDRDGRALLELTGLELRFLDGAQLTGTDMVGLVHTDGWEECPAPAAGRLDGSRWIVLGDGHGYGGHLAAGIRERGGQCTVVETGTAFVHDGDHCVLDPAEPDQWARLLRETGEARLVHCLALGSTRYDDAGTRALCGSLPAAVQAADRVGRPPAGITLVTCGAVPVLDAAEVRDPHPAMVWGLGRSLALELPELDVTLCDVDPGDPVASLRLLATTLADPGLPAETAVRQGRLYRTALRRDTSAGRDTARLSGRGCHLVTGGLGALGLRTAAWLAGRGARHVALASRGEPDPEAQSAVAQLRNSGVEVTVVGLDVTDEAAVGELVARAEKEWGGLRGVVHAAGVVDDAVVSRLDWASFARVLSPKVTGCLNLHRATLDCELEEFVLFSSTAALLGSPGQAHYAAGNAFLDAFAHYRRALGLPSLSVGWGPWSIGMADRMDRHLQDRLASSGFTPLEPEAAFAALDRALAGGQAQVGVFRLDWDRYRDRYPTGRSPQSPSRPDRSAGEGTHGAGPGLRHDWAYASAEQRAERAAGYLRTVLADRLGVSPAAIRPEVSLTGLGLDSLLAVEVRSRIRRDLDVDLPLTGLLDADAFHHLVQVLLQRLDESGAGADVAGPAAGDPARPGPHPAGTPLDAAPAGAAGTESGSGAGPGGALSPSEAERLLSCLDTLDDAEIRALEQLLADREAEEE